MLALRSPALDAAGAPTVSGDVPADMGALNAARIVEFCGRDDIPIYKGEMKPLVIDLVTAQDTHGEDGLGETFLPEPTLGYETGAVDFILSSLYEHDGDLTIIAVGPLTNIATALQRDEQAFRHLKNLIIMG